MTAVSESVVSERVVGGRASDHGPSGHPAPTPTREDWSPLSLAGRAWRALQLSKSKFYAPRQFTCCPTHSHAGRDNCSCPAHGSREPLGV